VSSEGFRSYFASRWDGDMPFPAAHFYYDAVVLLAIGLQYAAAQGIVAPTAADVRRAVLASTAPSSELGRWRDLKAVMVRLADGTAVRYAGAAAEYRFDKYGAATHDIFDSWLVSNQDFQREGAFQARCLRQPK
jgi:neutral amino acid transport system substrate-binding protein